MNKLVYLTYPVMLAILLIGSKFSRKNEWNEDFMSLEQSKYIQGYFAICIMLHHIGQETCASWQTYPLIPGLEFFVPIGHLLVAVFFMYSGFGLYKSYKAKNEYLNGFLRKRALPVLLAFLYSNWIFFIARIVMKEKMNGWKIFCYITGFGLPNIYAWFALILPLFYLIFYISFKVFKTDRARLTGVIVGVTIYTTIGTFIDHNDYWMQGEWWYNCVHLFWIGMLFAKYETKLTEHLKKHYSIYTVLAWVGTFLYYIVSEFCMAGFSYYGENNHSLSRLTIVGNRWICLWSQMLLCVCFVAVVLLLNMKIKFGNKLLGFMGGITLEFYLIHGLFLEFFSYKFCGIVPSITRIKNVALLIVIVFALSIPASLLFKKLINISKLKKE